MPKKFLRTSSVLATLLMTIVPAIGVQKFIINEDDLQGRVHTGCNKPLTISAGTLEWNGHSVDPIRSQTNPKFIEYIIANESEPGPDIVRGQRVTLSLMSRWSISDAANEPCMTTCMTVMCCPIFLPMSCCVGHWKTKEHQYMTQCIGQIDFSTKDQPQTLLLSVNRQSLEFLTIQPEE